MRHTLSNVLTVGARLDTDTGKNQKDRESCIMQIVEDKASVSRVEVVS